MTTTLVVFVLVYAVLLGGTVPGLRLDRTGAAIAGIWLWLRR